MIYLIRTKMNILGYVPSKALFLHHIADLASNFSLLLRQGILDHAWDGSLKVSVGDIDNLGVIFIDLLDDVTSDEDFPTDNPLDFRMRIVAGLSANVHFGITFTDLDADTHEVSVGDRPNALVLLIIDFENVFLFVEDLNLDNLGVDLSKRLFFFQERNNFLNVVLSSMHSHGGYSAIHLHFVLLARLRPVVLPAGG